MERSLTSDRTFSSRHPIDDEERRRRSELYADLTPYQSAIITRLIHAVWDVWDEPRDAPSDGYGLTMAMNRANGIMDDFRTTEGLRSRVFRREEDLHEGLCDRVLQVHDYVKFIHDRRMPDLGALSVTDKSTDKSTDRLTHRLTHTSTHKSTDATMAESAPSPKMV